MSRYDSSSTQSGSTGGDTDYDDYTNLKLHKNAAVRLTPEAASSNRHDEYGTSLIANFSAAEIIDGVVFQREDKPGTWKIFSADKFFHLNPEDGLVYENYDEDADEYSGEMSAQDILEAPRVEGYSENHFGDDYYFNPVGVVIEERGDIAMNDELDLNAEATDEPAIDVGEASIMESNKAWIRTFAKKISAQGDSVISDNGKDSTPQGEDEVNPKYDSFDWLGPNPSVELRDELEDRELELWITSETVDFDDGGSATYNTPNIMDVKTGEFVQIDNGVDGDGDSAADTDADGETAAATDGGTITDSTDDSGTESPDTTADPAGGSGKGETPDGVPEALAEILDYCARNGYTTTEGIKEFAGPEADDAESVDWDAATEFVQELAE